MAREIGTVVHVVADKGYWFILGKERRYFCHSANWSEANPPRVGDRVSFEIGPGKPGKSDQAVRVRPELSVGAESLLNSSVTVQNIGGVDVKIGVIR